MVEIDTLFQTKTAEKKPFGSAHTYTAYIRDYPPPPGAKNALQVMSIAACQEPIKWSLHLPYKPLEPTLSRVDL